MKEKLKGQRGASMVEFAIVLPLLLLLVFGIIEFGLLLYNKAMVTNASREGARAGIVYRQNPVTKAYSPLTLVQIGDIVKSYTSMNTITFASGTTTPTTTGTPCGTVGRGNDLTVTVTYPYTFLVFSNIANLFPTGAGTPFPGTITLSAETIMRCE